MFSEYSQQSNHSIHFGNNRNSRSDDINNNTDDNAKNKRRCGSWYYHWAFYSVNCPPWSIILST